MVDHHCLASNKARDEFMAYVNELSEHVNGNTSIHEITRRESDAYEEPTADQDQDDDETAEKRMYGRACAQIVSRITNASRKGNVFVVFGCMDGWMGLIVV